MPLRDLTPEELEVFELSGDLATAFDELPEQHSSDLPDVVNAIHVIQNVVLCRPAYENYKLAHGMK